MAEFTGKVVSSNLISLRFAEGGKLNSLKCHPGQIVKKRDLLASLDPKPVQTQLDIELADFRRTRAEFDQLTRQIPIAKTEDEKTKKEIAQSKLDVSVKTVEKYKLQLDDLNLYSPADAVIIDSGSLIEGINVTPSGFPIILAPLDSAVFECLVSEDNFYQLQPNQKAKVSLKSGFSIDSEVIYLSPQSNSNDTFTVCFKLPRLDLTNFRLGTSGKVSL
ncbi:hypothetical protein HYU90_00680 [Candidatus Collierbacteria bacterium]|nr:hypothetical protein [Candidatus Collierbacteria bacterium]